MDPESQTTILVVDDEPELCELVSLELEDEGFYVLSAHNGRQALDIVKKENIDVVVSDIRMPGGDGVELLDNIRTLPADKPVVFLVTGFSDLSTEDAYDKGAEAVFNKPVKPTILIDVIRKALTPREKRWVNRDHRIDTQLTVEVKLPDIQEAIQVKSLNLGKGGIFLALDQKHPRVDDGIEFKITFTDPNVTPIQGKGVVRWVRTKPSPSLRAGCGIEFVNLKPSTVSQVITLINAIKTGAFIPKT